MRWTRRTVNHDGVRLAVRDSSAPGGDGSTRPPIVLVHGLGTTQRSWDLVASRLAGECRVVTYDHRGHGRSSESATGECTISALVTDLVAVHDALGLREPVLVGHSLGATVAVEAAARRRCAGVVTVDGGLPVQLPATLDDRATFDAELRRPLVRLAGWLATRAGHGHRLTTDQLWQLTQELRRRERDLDAVYEQFTTPVLQVLPGRADPMPWGAQVHAATDAAASRFRAAHPGVTQLWLDAGHAIPLEQPAELAAEIRRFALVDR